MLEAASAAHADCLFCGADNPRSWGLSFEPGEDRIHMVATPSKELCGYAGVLHGGIVAAWFDETMVQCLLASGIPARTTRLEVDYLHPVPVEQELRIEAHLLRRRHGLFFLDARLCSGGLVCAKARAKFYHRETVCAPSGLG